MAQGLELFKTSVRSLLVQRCFKCHGGEQVKGEFDLSRRETLLQGGKTGPAIAAGNARASRLYKLITHAEKPAMPYKEAKLSDSAIGQIASWIDAGVPYDKPLSSEAAVAKGRATVTEADRHFWSFQPLKRAEPPSLKSQGWCRTPIDRFIMAKLEGKGLAANTAADRGKLIRRAYFDLIGLPPTPAEVEAFIADSAPDVYDKLIDRLLASPHYGERWGRHWLDLARFAESHGYEQDYDRPSAYHFRDFVIRALNADMPYDQFVRWQIAGDELAPDNPLALMATGFLAAGTHATQITANQVEKERYDELDDMAATIGTSMLGVTIGCARCHDHKFDPLPQNDYYRLLSTFTTTVRSEIDVDLQPERYKHTKAAFDRAHAVLLKALREIEVQLPARLERWLATNAAPAPARLSVGPITLDIARIFVTPAVRHTEADKAILMLWYRTIDPEWQKLNKAVFDHLQQEPKPKLTKMLVCSEGVKPLRLHTQGADFFDKTYFLRRGDLSQKVGEASQGFLQVLTRAPDQEKHWQLPPPKGWRTSYRRLSLARWITDPDQGAGHLLARVIVNRLWQHHIGRGIVATPSDFGAQGERPTHPELLDWLATELINQGWRLKPLHKLIMTSAVYMQTEDSDSSRAAADPNNLLNWRRSRRRLEGEVIRDAMLAVSGTLDRTMFGPGSLSESHRRRSIYFTIKRSQLIPLMILFDGPDTLQSMAARPSTTTAPQAMALMNNPQVRSYAHAFARRLLTQGSKSAPEAVRSSYWIALGRPPAGDELVDSMAFIQQQTDSYRSAGKADAQELALADYCQALISLNEFIYVD
jgi:mono/diheme cytochrome c family protein